MHRAVPQGLLEGLFLLNASLRILRQEVPSKKLGVKKDRTVLMYRCVEQTDGHKDSDFLYRGFIY